MAMFRFYSPGYEALVRAHTDHLNSIGAILMDQVAQVAMANCPVDTGFMQSSITWEWDDQAMRGRVSVLAPYAYFVEVGTVYQRAQPFLWPAMEQVPGWLPAAVGVEFATASGGGTIARAGIYAGRGFSGTI